MDSSQKYLTELVARVSGSASFKKKADAYYGDKLSGLYGHGSGFVEDLRSEVVTTLMEKINEGTFVLDDYEAGKTENEQPEIHFHKVQKWLMEALKNIGKERIRSRLPKQTPNGRGGDKMLLGSSFDESDYAGGLEPEKPEEFFGSLAQSDDDESLRDFDKSVALERFINAVGAENAAIAEDHLAGFSNVELAKKYGGTPDKYRAMFNRAKKKLKPD
ncbi:hypothetical protein ADIMK_3992 [Marinobacterium lacunae]|uniref:Uncharacterized protein n=1 Tax=Marinobacterium lacunae TaxID=1232683 RepID=A0A081FTJ0_9GAMM|nr:hypothetical protein [Marinobacterium lacunae]KEA61845.1 hypothetical protein ADIMK_3992 [Marinobacterium lacunae]